MLERGMRPWLMVVLLVACGGAQSGGSSEVRSIHDFPEPAKLDERLAAAPAPESLLSEAVTEAEGWRIEGDLPETPAPEPHESDSPEGRLILGAAASRPSVEATAAAHCLARETADHWLRTGRYAARGHRRFLAARCGVTGSSLSLLAVPLAETESVDDASADLLRYLEEHLDGEGLRHVGLAVARKDTGSGVAMLAVEHAIARLHIVRPKPTDQGFVLVRGRILKDVRYVTGYLNQGTDRVMECERANNLSLPEFAIRCVMDPADDHASLDVVAYEPDRMLGEAVASLLVRRDDATIRDYEMRPVGASTTPPNADEFARAVVSRVNGIREAGGLGRLRLAASQSQKMVRAVPHFFAPDADGELQDLIALTMIAGWNVEGLVQDASFSSSQVRERDVSRWVAYALERPFMRHTLLAPEADALAVSALVEPGGVSALFTHYELFDETRPRFDDVAVAILDRITEVRVARGLPAPTEVRDNSALQAEVDRVRTDGKDIDDALEVALRRSVRQWNHAITGFWMHVGGNPGAFTVPDSLLQPGELYLQAAATFHRAPGAPWGQYLVFLVTTR